MIVSLSGRDLTGLRPVKLGLLAGRLSSIKHRFKSLVRRCLT
jgi:hypothetical protein